MLEPSKAIRKLRAAARGDRASPLSASGSGEQLKLPRLVLPSFQLCCIVQQRLGLVPEIYHTEGIGFEKT